MTIKTQRLLVRAKKIAKKGEIEEARKLYTTILEASPNNQEAKNGLLALEQSKDKLSPPNAEIQSVFALYNNGQIQEALDSVETLPKTILMNHYSTISVVFVIKQSVNWMLRLRALRRHSLSNQTTLR